ncbi:MAG: hypothetical protein J5699_02930 [Bacteroidales bacterium]|nr:hypothetical protein [Bacteroidales bacterium]
MAKKSKKSGRPVPVNLGLSGRGELLRKYRKTILLNEKEVAAISQYCAKYKIRSKSAFIRNVVMSHILSEMDENYPKLF